jgi:hypothetical protein
MTEYRIRNTENNLQIQRKVKDSHDRWTTISYHGHSIKSLISGLLLLTARDLLLNDLNLLDALETLRLEVISSEDKIEEMVREYFSNN